MLTVIFCLFMLSAVLYRYLTRNFQYWKEMGLDGPTPMVGFGTIFAKITTPMPILEVQWLRKYGNLYGLFLGNEPVLTVAEPRLVKDILIKDFNNFFDRRHLNTYHEIVNLNLFFVLGKQWKRIRAIVTPSFSNSKLKSMYHLMENCVDNTCNFLCNLCTQKEEEVDMKQILGNLTMDVIAMTAFATKINSNVDTCNPFLVNARKFFNMNPIRYLSAFLLPKCVLKHLIKSQFTESTNQFFINTSRHIIQERKAKNIHNNDLIQLLMDAEIDSKKIQDFSGLNKEGGQNNKLSENEILAQCWVIFLAGYETTSTTISFCLYELALNAEIQNKLFNEIWKETKQGTNYSFDIINKIEYLEAVVFETLRKYPPLIRLERTADKDYQLSETNIVIKKGQVVEIPIYAMHHSEDNFPNADKFQPDRFLLVNKTNIKPYTFIPFGLGPRNCIGLKFAMMEIKLAISKLVCNFVFNVSSKTNVPVKFNPVTPFLATNDNFLLVNKRITM